MSIKHPGVYIGFGDPAAYSSNGLRHARIKVVLYESSMDTLEYYY